MECVNWSAHQVQHEGHFQFERISRNIKLSSYALCMMNYYQSSWRSRNRENIIVDVSSNVSSDEEQTDRFYFIRLVSVNFRDDLSNADRLAWNIRAKLLSRTPALG